MKVALTGEGTYPHQFGGVSVWCDQLVRGLPHCDFTLVPLVATGNEPMRWQLPDNVTSVRTIPLWGRPPTIPWRARLARGRDDSLLHELIDVLLSPPGQAQDRFTAVMHELFIFAQTRNLHAALSSENAVRLVSEAWRQRWPDILPEVTLASPAAGPGDEGQDYGEAGAKRVVPTLGDAVVAMQLLEHALRPFSHPPVQADVVHVVTNGLGALPAFAAKWRYGLPMLVTEHGVYMREQYLHLRRPEFGWPVKDLYLRFLRRVCTLGYHEADVITPGNIYNKRWEAELGADESRVRTVYNGVDPAIFPVLSEEPEIPTISWAGRIDPVKDLVTLLRAFSLVVREIPQARLRIFGSPPQGGEEYLEHCQSEAAELGISEQATFEGRVPEIRDAYAAGHVVVLCSITEGFPYTLIEAMACGRPCVATNVGGVSEAVGDDAGIVVPPRNPAALADACLRLLRDDGLRRTMGAAARERALEHFTMDRAISAFDELYTSLGGGDVPAAVRAAAPDAGFAVTAPQPVAGGNGPGITFRADHWIALPPEDESTLVLPKLATPAPAETDEDVTQVLPVLGGHWLASDPDHTIILPRMVSGTTFDPDQTRPLPVLRLQAPELAGEDEIAAVPAGGRADEQSAEPPGEGESDEREQAAPNLPGSSSPADATTALPRLKEAMR
jgi:glycosyltransferase involved in cell wall biosynthesis